MTVAPELNSLYVVKSSNETFTRSLLENIRSSLITWPESLPLCIFHNPNTVPASSNWGPTLFHVAVIGEILTKERDLENLIIISYRLIDFWNNSRTGVRH